MADDEKTEKTEETRVCRTAGISGTFHVGDLEITPEGTELTREQWLTVADAATVNHVIVRLDEDFPVVIAESTPEPQSTPSTGEETKTEETGTAVDGSTTPSSPSPGSTRKAR